jgi:hypothetical protein
MQQDVFHRVGGIWWFWLKSGHEICEESFLRGSRKPLVVK